MALATVTTKGQITIPAEVRKALHIHAGDRIEFVETGTGRFEVIAGVNDVSGLKGLVKTTSVVSIEAMNSAIKSRAS